MLSLTGGNGCPHGLAGAGGMTGGPGFQRGPAAARPTARRGRPGQVAQIPGLKSEPRGTPRFGRGMIYSRISLVYAGIALKTCRSGKTELSQFVQNP
jgi:hypothetical protein